MSFILKMCLIQQITFLSILGVLRSLHLSRRADNMETVAQFYSPNYNTMLSQWQFTATRSLHLSLLCIYPQDQSGSI